MIPLKIFNFNHMKTTGNILRIIALAFIITTFFSCNNRETRYTPEREAEITENFINSLIGEDYDVDTTNMGVYYVITEEGEGDFVQPDDSIGIIYTGFFPESGNIFDSSEYWYEDGIWKFIYLSTDLIQGFDDAISHLNTGAEGIFLIPSELAYGKDGNFNGSIPPYSALVFNIKLVEIYE